MTTARTLEELPLTAIHPDPEQPRKAFGEAALEQLAASIKADGVREPILVRHDRGQGRYLITAGERRWRAARKAGLKTIPAIVEELALDQIRVTQLVENLQREDLNPLELATAYVAYRKATGENQAQLAKRLGIDQGTVSLQERLLELPQDAKDLLVSGNLTRFHARQLLRLKDHAKELGERVTWLKRFPRSAEQLRSDVDGDLQSIKWAAEEQARRAKKAAKAAKGEGKKGKKAAKPAPRKKASWEIEADKRRAAAAAAKALEPWTRKVLGGQLAQLLKTIRAIAARELRVTPAVAQWLLEDNWFGPYPKAKRTAFDDVYRDLLGKKLGAKDELALELWISRDAHRSDAKIRAAAEALREQAVAATREKLAKSSKLPARKGGRK